MPCHLSQVNSYILGARSEVFKKMVLLKTMKEGEQRQIDIVCLKDSTFKEFVKYLYSGSAPHVPDEQYAQLYCAAHM